MVIQRILKCLGQIIFKSRKLYFSGTKCYTLHNKAPAFYLRLPVACCFVAYTVCLRELFVVIWSTVTFQTGPKDHTFIYLLLVVSKSRVSDKSRLASFKCNEVILDETWDPSSSLFKLYT